MNKPDYVYWDAQPQYSLTHAAALCCDLEPENWTVKDPAPPRVSAMRTRLVREVPYKDATRNTSHWNDITHEHYTRRIPGDKFFERDALRQWAEKTGQRALMPFLFPEDREPEGAESPAMRADTRESLLLLIGLLSHALAEKGGPDLKTTKGPKQAGIIRELRKVARQLGVPLEGLSDTVLNDRLAAALSEVNHRKSPAP